MPFIILFVLIPLAEVYVFITVGDQIGALKTLLLCVITAIIGGTLVKFQGLQTMLKARQNFMAGTIPLEEIFDGICLIIAGALLLTPGFVTDIIGFSLLVPAFRRFLRPLVAKYGKFNVQTHNGPSSRTQGDIIEGDYQDVTDDKEKLDKSGKPL